MTKYQYSLLSTVWKKYKFYYFLWLLALGAFIYWQVSK
jgi:hypothetical protein